MIKILFVCHGNKYRITLKYRDSKPFSKLFNRTGFYAHPVTSQFVEKSA